MSTIELGNGHSKLITDRETLQHVRHLVSYRKTHLPPSIVQATIKAYFADHRRRGGDWDVRSIQGSARCRRVMDDAGFDPDDLDVRMLEALLRQQGCWDGWSSLVTAKGAFPTGLLRWVERAVVLRCDQRVGVDDLRPAPPPPRPLGRDTGLFEFQRAAVDAFLAEGRGVWDLPPRSGKTRAAVAVVAELGLPTIYIVPGKGLAKQTADVFNALLGPGTAEAVTGGRQSQKTERRLHHTLVWVTTTGTAANLSGIGSRIVLIFDEFHHAAAKSWRTVSERATNAWWRLGMTGTHFRADGRDMEMAGVLGRAVYSRSVSDMVGLGRLVPARIAMIRVRGRELGKHDEYYADGVVEHEERNRTLVWATIKLLDKGRRVLALVKEKRHGRALAEQIPGSIFVSGEDNAAVEAAIVALQAGTLRCVIGTTVIGEGRDIPGADALVYFKAGKTQVGVTQDYFRVLTRSPGKQYGIVVDAADTHDKTLTHHAAQRLQLYRSEPAFDAQVMEWGDFEGWLG